MNKIVKQKLFWGTVILILVSSLSGCHGSFLQSSSDSDSNQEVKFDLSQYQDHGDLSCGLIWASKYQWSDDLDGNYEMFAYFDVDGNQKSSWFNTEDFFTANFDNNYLILESVKKVGDERWHDHRYSIYDTNFNCIVNSLNCESEGRITHFNDYGYAFAKTLMELFYIDASGLHEFEEHITCYDVYNIETTEKYFNVEGKYLCDHQGKLLVDIGTPVEDYIKSTDNYSRERVAGHMDDYYITLTNIKDNESIDVTFNAKNTKSNNIVEFTCKIGFDGRFIEEPEKPSGEDVDIVSDDVDDFL